MGKPLIIIDVPHGGKDPGAVANGMVEKKLAFEMAMYDYNRFKELGIPVALVKTSDVTLTPEQRTEIIRESGAKICLSGHLNAAGAASAAGLEVIHSIHSDGKLAKMIYDNILGVGRKGRRVFFKKNSKGKDWYYMHRDTGSVQTIITELGFITNKADAEDIKKNWKKYEEAKISAVCRYLGKTYKPPVEVKTQPPKADKKGGFIIQAGYFDDAKNAEEELKRIQSLGVRAFIKEVDY